MYGFRTVSGEVILMQTVSASVQAARIKPNATSAYKAQPSDHIARKGQGRTNVYFRFIRSRYPDQLVADPLDVSSAVRVSPEVLAGSRDRLEVILAERERMEEHSESRLDKVPGQARDGAQVFVVEK